MKPTIATQSSRSQHRSSIVMQTFRRRLCRLAWLVCLIFALPAAALTQTTEQRQADSSRDCLPPRYSIDFAKKIIMAMASEHDRPESKGEAFRVKHLSPTTLRCFNLSILQQTLY
jgi:hypothetical protein